MVLAMHTYGADTDGAGWRWMMGSSSSSRDGRAVGEGEGARRATYLRFGFGGSLFLDLVFARESASGIPWPCYQVRA